MAEDFGFTDDHGLESGADFEEVTKGFEILVDISLVEAGLGDAEKILHAGLKFAVDARGGHGRDEIKLDPVAGGEDDHFVEGFVQAKELQHLNEGGAGEGEFFPDIHGHGAVVDADAVKVHESGRR
ncbi:MAG: hypothetical protein HC904_17325 [Blastochloris sp.]|nr:hypothetical protein [Blastochloris sp.]